jgi:hypothetical protein
MDAPLLNIEYFFYGVYDFLVNYDWQALRERIQEYMPYVNFVSTVLSVILLIGIISLVIRIKRVSEEEAAKLSVTVVPAYAAAAHVPDTKLAEKWNKILTHVDSANQNDWLLAIIEADIILGEILDKMGYRGEGIGEKLKRVEKSDFRTLDSAWEAHKVRNAIAHQGSDFVINQREAKRVISLYKDVFEEFYYI